VTHSSDQAADLQALLESLGGDVVQLVAAPRGLEVAVGEPVIYDESEHSAIAPGVVVLAVAVRPGTPEADAVPGARDRVVLRGRLTVDGAPFDAQWVGAVVRIPFIPAFRLAADPLSVTLPRRARHALAEIRALAGEQPYPESVTRP